jgi:hypothetical protein
MGLSAEAQQAIFEKHAKQLPVGYVAKPEDIAHAYIFLMK